MCQGLFQIHQGTESWLSRSLTLPPVSKRWTNLQRAENTPARCVHARVGGVATPCPPVSSRRTPCGPGGRRSALGHQEPMGRMRLLPSRSLEPVGCLGLGEGREITPRPVSRSIRVFTARYFLSSPPCLNWQHPTSLPGPCLQRFQPLCRVTPGWGGGGFGGRGRPTRGPAGGAVAAVACHLPAVERAQRPRSELLL